MRQALKVFYDGKNFFGSQRQPDKRTVEGELLSSLKKLKINLKDFKGACRTDRGVSSLGNVYAVSSDIKVILGAINSKLPEDIRVLAAKKVDEDFNPRHDALGKTYKYFLFDEGYSYNRLKKAAGIFKGKLSFHNFSISDGRNPVRIIKSINVKKEEGFFVFTIIGESFLWQMIRRLMGAVKMAGEGKMDLEDIERLLDPQMENKISSLSPENLVLWEVEYPFEFTHDDHSAEMLKKDILKKRIEAKRESLISRLLIEEL